MADAKLAATKAHPITAAFRFNSASIRCVGLRWTLASEDGFVTAAVTCWTADIGYDWSRINVPKRLSDFEHMWTQRHNPLRFSGVWRFHELIQFVPADKVVTVGEGQTLLQQANQVRPVCGHEPRSVVIAVRRHESFGQL